MHMKRHTFLLIGGISQLFLGFFFLLFTDTAAAQNMVEITESALMLQKNIGVFSIAFGIVTLLARRSGDSLALRAILIGTIFYLIASSGVDSYGILSGAFTSMAWGGIAVRVIFIFGYFYYLVRIEVDEPPLNRAQ